MNFKAPKSNIYHESSINYFEGVDLDLNPNSYPKKFQQFVTELSVLLENVVLSNEMIDNADYKSKVLDDNVRLVVSNLRDLSSNFVL